jgi:hypothetical protein
MKFIGSKFGLPIASAVAVLALVGAQAMALSQTPGEEITNPVAESDVSSDPVVSDPALTPIDIPTDGSTALPIGDDDAYEDDAYEDDSEDSQDDSYEDDSDDQSGDDEDTDDEEDDDSDEEEGDDD